VRPVSAVWPDWSYPAMFQPLQQKLFETAGCHNSGLILIGLTGKRHSRNFSVTISDCATVELLQLNQLENQELN
jgi:hypothetical protein